MDPSTHSISIVLAHHSFQTYGKCQFCPDATSSAVFVCIGNHCYILCCISNAAV